MERDSVKEVARGGEESEAGRAGSRVILGTPSRAHLLCPCAVAEQCCTEPGTCILLHMEHVLLGWVLLLGTWTGASAASSKNWLIKDVAMDMANNSFDDQYQGCIDLMEAELPELNSTEFSNKIYAEGWRSATELWQSRSDNATSPVVLGQDQAIAVLAYTMEGDLYRVFNNATLTAGRSRQHYLSSYPFKTLHFLLSRALQILRESQPQQCYNVYRGVKGIRFTAQQGQVVRFGQFTSSSLKEKVAEGFAQGTFYWVETCYGVPIKEFSAYPYEDEVLIPPCEQFEVTSVTYKNGRSEIHLRSQGNSSTYNCEFVKGRSSPMESPHLWLLILAAAALAAVGES
ncbi:erythroblast NAD(P)(+)--arginine ADP-ribosyltransferase-like [Meleagris gallopavo]|uniref:NAD(P)(+)--arginine ADP-ribosyltransferase n=1 Tax=Meleagris gallopavo TaxID=9103 RepID=A0A803YFB8_MELGA|nr:erythroblast NAD(P)(+)--arginine ADP-ribosyltransferase-like [Meleagris gallopavo]